MSYVDTNEFKNFLAFAIEVGGEEVLSRSPEWFVQKFYQYNLSSRLTDEWRFGLGAADHMILLRYLIKWKVKNAHKDTAKV